MGRQATLAIAGAIADSVLGGLGVIPFDSIGKVEHTGLGHFDLSC
jgi:hypothetical protein